jgi:hypothetical protein
MGAFDRFISAISAFSWPNSCRIKSKGFGLGVSLVSFLTEGAERAASELLGVLADILAKIGVSGNLARDGEI